MKKHFFFFIVIWIIIFFLIVHTSINNKPRTTVQKHFLKKLFVLFSKDALN